jgi:hypothetical protein
MRRRWPGNWLCGVASSFAPCAHHSDCSGIPAEVRCSEGGWRRGMVWLRDRGDRDVSGLPAARCRCVHWIRRFRFVRLVIPFAGAPRPPWPPFHQILRGLRWISQSAYLPEDQAGKIPRDRLTLPRSAAKDGFGSKRDANTGEAARPTRPSFPAHPVPLPPFVPSPPAEGWSGSMGHGAAYAVLPALPLKPLLPVLPEKLDAKG